MREICLLLSMLAAPVTTWSQSVARQPAGAPVGAAEPGTAQVMILGVAHLVSRRDVHNSTFQDSPLSPARQAQISDVIDHLSRFQPTKVLIEKPMGDTGVTDRYRRFRAGQFTLEADESYQFGFRLAARAGDSTIYPINSYGPSLINDSTASGKRITAFLEANFASVSTPAFQAYLAHSDTLERHGTYLDLLRYLNTDVAIRANASIYSVLVGIGRDADDAGSAYVSEWYARNCYIFSNMLSVTRPGDRVVVIYGQGHEYLLREFVRLNPTLVNVDPLDYLK
jgi:hypothetical protein